MDQTSEFVNDSTDLEEMVTAAKDFCYSHGITLRMKEDPTTQDSVRYFPFSLFPSPVPKQCYQQALDVQKDYNLLMHTVAQDYDFLKECLQSVIEVDEFTRNLWTIHKTVIQEGISKPFYLEQNRSDYIIDKPVCHNDTRLNIFRLKQVEFNTMAAGCAGVGPQLVKLHRYMLSKAGHCDKIDNIAPNDSCEGMAKAFVAAWKLYNNPKSVIMFLVLPVETNTYDQRLMEYGIIKENPNIKVIFRTLKDIQERGYLNNDKCLILDNLDIAVIYQRCGYSPGHFKNKKDWDTRLLMERSRTIISPSISYHLAGTKKVQQVLAQPGNLERLLKDADSIRRIRSTFSDLSTLDLTEEGDLNTLKAIENPHKYVLKPQREGGGNNKFGFDVKTTLEQIGRTSERSAYIIMERLHPYTFQNYPVSGCGEVKLTTLVTEVGIFGSLVGTHDYILLNQCHGFLLRSKQEEVNEGGVMTGSAVLDTPYLVSV